MQSGLKQIILIMFWLPLLLAATAACSPITPAATSAVAVVEVRATESLPTPLPVAVNTGLPPSPTPPPTATWTPAPTAVPSPTPTATPIPSPTPDRTVPCSRRIPDDSLLTIITLTYGLSRDFEPADLVPLADYLPGNVTLGYPTELRRVVVEPLVAMVTDMQAAGLNPTIISGYRSYAAQAIARQKWLEKEPERANILSAPPGFSEHQLGTVIDFGSPELPDIVGQPDIEFHTWFYKTSEGIWLLENAHRYGFTLSYPFDAFETTGFFYEPWHYRYVGVETATWLKEVGISLTEYQLTAELPPCVPDQK